VEGQAPPHWALSCARASARPFLAVRRTSSKMEDGRTLPPVVAAGGGTPRETMAPFVRASLQKLRADTSRRPVPPAEVSPSTTLDSERALRDPAQGTAARGLLLDLHAVGAGAGVTGQLLSGAGAALTARPCEDSSPWPPDRCLVRDRCYLNGFLTHDLERYREAFAEELRCKLRAVQAALEQANVAGLAERLFDRLDTLQAQGEQELKQLRSQCTELLRLNAQLRQQQIDANCSHLRSTAEKISAMVATLDAWDGVDMDAVSRAVGRALEPLQQGQQNMQAKLKRVESFNCDLVAEFRKMLREELEPLKSGQQSMHAKLKRVEGLAVESSRQRVHLKEEMERLLDVHVRRASVVDAKIAQLQAAAGGAGGGEEAAAGVDPSVGFVASASGATEVTDAVESLGKATRDMLASLSEERAKVFANQGKMSLNQNAILDNLQAIHTSMASVQGDLGRVNDGIQDFSAVVAKQMTSLEVPKDTEVQRLRQQLTARNTQLAELKRSLEEKGSIVPFLGRIQEIEKRGNLRIDLRSGDVTLGKEIMFKSRRQSEEPVAEFADEGEILADLAELWDNFRVDMAVEGHTKGGENEFWQELASNRARLVAAKLEEMGVRKDQLHPEGLPGKLGKNIAAVDVRLDIFPDLD